MTQLVGYTRKILASAISSIADELEQTVLDFNDAIHVLSSQQSLKQEGQSHREAKTIDSRLENSSPSSTENVPTATIISPSVQRHVDRDVIGRSHIIATTRQPEAIGFSPFLDVRLSRSSPSLLPDDAGRLVFHEKRKKSTSPLRQCLTKSPSMDSAMSTSSPCLVHIPATARSYQQPATDIARHVPHISRSPVSEVITRGITSTEVNDAGTKYTRIQQNNVLNKIGQKRPGKVVRSQCLIQNIHPEAPSDQIHTIWSSCKVDTGTQTETESDSALVLSSAHEREARLTRWFTLRPITQVLSFAFSQFANIVLMFADESQSSETAGPRQHRRQLSMTFDDAQNNSTVNRDANITDSYGTVTFGISKESNTLEPPMLSSTYSCESFEIIDTSSSSERLSCSPRDADSSGDTSFLSRLYSDSNATQTKASACSLNDLKRIDDTDSLTASAEFFQFNFKDLVSNRQFNKLNPVGGVTTCTSTDPDEQSASDVKSESTVDAPSVRVEGAHDFSDTRFKSEVCAVKEEEDSDDDDDGSASFTVLSENGDEEFIVLDINK